MTVFKQEKLLSRLISIGGLLTTLLIWTEYGTDPVNLPKVLVASAFGFAALAIILYFSTRETWTQSRAQLVLLAIFLACGVNAVINSDSPYSQNYYGIFGRETGFLTYLILAFFLFASSLISSMNSVQVILNGLLLGGLANIIYCFWVTIFGDFIKWNNVYGSILGTLGNPDFVSSYLGMFNAVLFAYLAFSRHHIKWKIAGFILSVGSIFLIKESHAIQGLVITVLSLIVVMFYLIRARFTSIIPTLFFTALSATMAGFAITGSLGHGPLGFIYKASVSLRGTYWEVATRIGSSHPLTGVGFDTYGDWYRVVRPARALVDTPPITVTSNVAHNVFLDMYASGGWPLLISYCGVIGIGLFSIIRITFRQKNLNYECVAVIAAWSAYVAQSIISINQVGLAIWGWILTGVLVSLDRYSQKDSSTTFDAKPKSTASRTAKSGEKFLSPNLVAGIGLLVGIFLAFPPVAADGKWRKAIESKNLAQVIDSLTPTFMNPASSMKYAQAIQMFMNSNLPDEEYKYSKIATNYNRNSFEAWQSLYTSTKSTNKEKELSLANMRRLDPGNPNLARK